MTGIKDVAAKAHVSISTVSYVMSGKRSIGDDTKHAVLDAAKELGYRPRKATPDVMAFLTGQPYTEHTGQGGQSPHPARAPAPRFWRSAPPCTGTRIIRTM